MFRDIVTLGAQFVRVPRALHAVKDFAPGNRRDREHAAAIEADERHALQQAGIAEARVQRAQRGEPRVATIVTNVGIIDRQEACRRD